MIPRKWNRAAWLVIHSLAVALVSLALTANASAQRCKALKPAGAGLDDAATINDCLRDQGIAKLKAGTFLLFSPIVFPRNKPDAPVGGVRLLGKSKDATRLVVQSECGRPWPFVEETTPGQHQPIVQVVRSPRAEVRELEIDVTNLRQDCGTLSNFMVVVNKSPGSTVRGVRIKGSAYSSGAAYTSGGANGGGILVVNAADAIVTDNEIKDVGFTFENGSASGGYAGIEVGNSANSVVQNNRLEHVAFGIVVSNGSPAIGYTGDSSGTTVTDNTIVGAANLRCLNCSQGRGIKLQACNAGDELPLRGVTVSRNVVTEFGGHNSIIGGSGLDLVCGVQYSTFEQNRFIGAPTAEFSLQIRSSVFAQPNPTYHNTIQFNTFASGRGSSECRDACVDVNFTYDGPDQIGLSRSQEDGAGNNTASSFRAETDRGCGGYSHAYFLYLDGREYVRQGERILLTAVGVRPNSTVTFKLRRAEDGAEVATYQSLSANRNCIMNQEYLTIDATRFPTGAYKIFADYKDGNSDAAIASDEIGAIKVKAAKSN